MRNVAGRIATNEELELLRESMAWLDARYEPDVGLIRMPPDAHRGPGPPTFVMHHVTQTMRYAVGLFMRDASEDRPRALRAVDAVLDLQLDEPGAPFHGTWLAGPWAPVPDAGTARVWKDYDPNWREFVGTGLAVVLLEWEALLPTRTVLRVERAVRLAVEGAVARALKPGYTNIAAMSAFLRDFAGTRFGVEAWTRSGDELAAAVAAPAEALGAFTEFNSPTYDGISLYGLALIRRYGSTPRIRERGARLERLLWRSVATRYHPGLRNVAGPYDRSYGVDARTYLAAIGLWIWSVVGRDRAPLPDASRPFAHAWDVALAPLVVLLGVPDREELARDLVRFAGPRLVTQVVAEDPRRVATSWLDERVMLGAEDTHGWKRSAHPMFHAATAHWATPGGSVATLCLRNATPVDARAEAGVLHLCSARRVPAGSRLVVEIRAEGGLDRATFAGRRWTVPGMDVAVRGRLALESAEVAGDVATLTCGLTTPGRRERIAASLWFAPR